MSEGFCDVDFGDFNDDSEPVQFFDWKMVTGRKAYVCTECGEAIAIGERHKRISYKFEGKFSVDRLCAPCHETAGEFEYNVIGGFLWESFHDQWENGAHLQSCLNRLESARAKEHMRRQWLKWKGLPIEDAPATNAVDPSAQPSGTPSARVSSSGSED